VSTLHIADTGLFVAMGQSSNSRYEAVRRFARRNDITFVLPERVYEELTPDAATTRTTPVETAIEEGWATVADPLVFSKPIVSRVMDGVQRYIANADDRSADEVERADPALAALAVQALSAGTASKVFIYTTDIAAGEGAEAVLASEGYGDSLTFVNGFRFIEDLELDGN
jgi:tagatose-1,6-bisphosphate aldolase